MPGSHDAGVWATPNKSGNVKTTNWLLDVGSIAAQLGDIEEQARAGSRWFDIRMYKTPTRYLPFEGSLRPAKVGGHKMKMRAAHVPTFQEGAIKKGILQSPGLGGYGASVEQILDQALNFVSRHDTEFIVIRFSHCPEPRKVLKEIKRYLDDSRKKLCSGRILTHKSPGVQATLGNTPMKALRGKVAMIFDGLFHKYTSDINYCNWIFTYSKVFNGRGDIGCCGAYADSPKIAVVKDETLQAVESHLAHGNVNGHLCFVYWQLTERNPIKQLSGDGNIHDNTTGAAGTHAHTDDLMAKLTALRGDAKKNGYQMAVAANVISHDFVKPNISKKIVSCNTDPNVIKGHWPPVW
jgi:hypothetical protein